MVEQTDVREQQIGRIRLNLQTTLPDYLKVEDIARYLRIGRSSAYELCNQPGFPVLRIGKTIRVPKHEFLRWCSAHVRQRCQQQSSDGHRVQ